MAVVDVHVCIHVCVCVCMCVCYSKVLCSRGAIAKVRIEWFNHGKYTGLFKQAEHGLIRLTSAFLGNESLPSWLGSVSSSKIFPCCALKFFRGNGTNDDNTHSGNFLFGGKKTGQTVCMRIHVYMYIHVVDEYLLLINVFTLSFIETDI